MTTPNAMPKVLHDDVLPMREYVMPMAPLTIGERLGMDKHLVRWALDGQPHNGFWLIATEDNARVRVTL